MSSYVIENPASATALQRYGQRVLTMIFWILFALLLRPLFTVFAWILGGHLFFEAMHIQETPWAALSLPLGYLAVIFIISVLFFIWANYNLWRFGKRERRKQRPPAVEPTELARFFHLEADLVRHWQSSRRIVMSHDHKMRPLDPRERKAVIAPGN